MLQQPFNDPIEARMARLDRLLQKHDVDLKRLWLLNSRTDGYVGDAGLNPAPAAPSHVITGATNATPIVITSANHGLLTGTSVTIFNVRGNTAANGTWVVTALTANTFSLDTSVGNGAYVANRAVTTATNATPIVVTSNSHGFNNGDVVTIRDVLGNTNANGIWTVANKTTNTFELAGSVGNAAYTSGGLINAGQWT